MNVHEDVVRDFVRVLVTREDHGATSSSSVDMACETLKIIHVLLRNFGTEKENQDIRFTQARIKFYICDAPGGVDFMLKVCPFTRQHLIAGDFNGFVFRAKPGQVQLAHELAQALMNIVDLKLAEDIGAVSEEEMWWSQLSIAIKVTLPDDGRELLGMFCPLESIGHIRDWVERAIVKPHASIVIAASWDPKLELVHDEQLIVSWELHKKRLIVKKHGGADLGRRVMEETQRKLRMEQAMLLSKQVDQFRKTREENERMRREEEANRAANLRKFDEDRVRAEQRAQREIKQAGTRNKS